MRTNENQNQKLDNGKDLLRQCVKRLKEGQRGEAGGNRALYPVVIVLMGEKCKENTRYIKSTLDDNFDNARYLQYVSVVMSDGECRCSVLEEVESDNYDELVWKDMEYDFKGTVDFAVGKMMSNGVFGKRTSVKIEYIIEATEEEGKSYYDLYKNTKCSYNITVLQTMYLMLNQDPNDDKLKRSEELMRHVVDSYQENRIGTIYMISNNLANGIMLDENTVWKNYRLVADIMLLGDNQNGDQGSVLYNGIKTVSYTLNTKPSDEIAVVSLQAMIEEMKKVQEDNAEKELAMEHVRRRLGMQATGGMDLAKELFSEIKNTYPKAQNLMYLPFRSEQDYHDMLKNDRITIKALDGLTYGAATAYVNMHYIEPVEKYFQSKEKSENCHKQIRQLILKNFQSAELLELAKKLSEFISIWQNEELSFEGFGASKDIFQRIHIQAVYEGEKRFVAKVKEILIEEFTKLTEAAEALYENYGSIAKEVQKESGAIVYDGDINDEFEAYRTLVKNFVRGAHSVNMTTTSFEQVFTPTEEKSLLVKGLWNAFSDLMRCDEFSYDFEKALVFKMKEKNDIDKIKVIQDWVNSNPLNDICLNEAMKVQLQSKGCFYLVNKEADYVEQFKFKQQDGNYSLFYLNRTDSIERVAIYDITNPEILHLMVEG